MVSKTFRTNIVREGSSCFIPLTFDPKTVFGQVRVPVQVTLNGHTYRSTIAALGGSPCIPLRKTHREAAGLEGGETIDVRLDLDTEKREIAPPADFVEALKAKPQAWERWRGLSYTRQPLCHADLGDDVLSRDVGLGDAIDQRLPELDLGRHLGDLELRVLKAGDRFAERGASLHVFAGVVERAAAHRNRADGHDQALL